MPCAFAGTPRECKLSRRPFEQLPLPKWDGPAVGKKALCYPGKNEIWIDRKFFEGLKNAPAQLYIYFHECGHLEGAVCEPCADRRAGEWLKWWGIGVARDPRIAAIDTLENRSGLRAQAEIAEGFGLDTPAPSWFSPQTRGLEHGERLEGIEGPLLAFAYAVAISLNKAGVRVVAGVDGGKRTDEAKQLGYYNAGLSNAKTLAETPHGLGRAMDLLLYPPNASAPLPDNHPAWNYMGELAEKAGFKWGGRFPKPDRPHIEIKNWRDYLPSAKTTGAVLIGLLILAAGALKK